MNPLQTTYMGFTLRSPIIAGSSGMTKSLRNLEEIEKNGAGAVVLKSLFEEQIRNDIKRNIADSHDTYAYPEAFDYISNFTKAGVVDEYLTLIGEAKKSISIPVIASINCVSGTDWIEYAKRFEDAGADALELNIFILPSDLTKSADDTEKTYFEIVENVKKQTSIPISVKIGYYFTSLAKTVVTLSWTGIKGIVLFNRAYSPDINIETMQISPPHVFSSPEESALPMRWIALLSDRTHCDLAGSTGVHTGEAAVKLILAGASAVQVCSVLYKKKFSAIAEINAFIADWMKKNNFESIDDFKGTMSYKNIPNPAAYERVQFMKYFAGIE
ncbi:MAG: dihydroorotate dehydrogenase-like protein [Syntrophales bacterium]|nr:dihydroorotate dehydrogenase-like protein [Syntrophales bacterium]